MDSGDFSLVPVGPDGAEELSEIAYPLYREVYAHVPSDILEDFLRMEQTPEAIRDQMGRGLNYWYIYSGGERAGYLCCGKDDAGMYLSKLYFFKNFRGRGLGDKALRFVESEARRLGCGKIHLDVNIDNHPAIRFYERNGFSMTVPLTHVRMGMEKNLDNRSVIPVYSSVSGDYLIFSGLLYEVIQTLPELLRSASGAVDI